MLILFIWCLVGLFTCCLCSFGFDDVFGVDLLLICLLLVCFCLLFGFGVCLFGDEG